MLSAEQMMENYERFMSLIEEDSRSEELKAMYESMTTQLVEAPASSFVHFHNSFPGGYLSHILHVFDIAVQQAKLFKLYGGKLDFTGEELRFAALHHDLGKLGENDDRPYYTEETSDWHRARGKMYGINENMQYMNVTDRSLFLLQQHGIQITQNEFLGIKLADGLFNASSPEYLEKTQYPYQMHTSLPYIIHWADYMASVIERGNSRF